MTNPIINLISDTHPLVRLLGDFEKTHVGFIFAMGFAEAHVLTNDKWKERVRGIPHNSFLVAASFDPANFAATTEIDQEVLLLRVMEPIKLPQDDDLIRTRIEQHQRRTEARKKDEYDGYDPITHSELQFGGLACRIIGTFYIDAGKLRLGSDIENFSSCSHLRVYRPSGTAL